MPTSSADKTLTDAQPTAAPVADTITEGKLSRVEMIAREALDILGEAAPEDLRRSVADERARHELELREVEEKLADMTASLASLERELKSAQRLAEDRLEEAEEVWSLARNQAADLASASGTIKSLTDDLTLSEITAESRGRELLDLRARLADSDQEIASARREADVLREELDELSSDRDGLRDTLAAANQRVEALEADLVEARDAFDTRTRELDEMLATTRGAQADAEATTERVMADLETAESLIEALNTQIEGHKEHEASRAHELVSLRDQLAVRAATLRDTEERLQNAREKIASLETRVETLSSSHQTLVAERDDAVSKLDAARSEIASLRRELADFSARLADRDKTIAALSSPDSDAEPGDATHTEQPSGSGATAAAEDWIQEIATLREQLDRADTRASTYRTRAHDAERKRDKALTMVRRARRRACKRTELYENTIQAMTQMRTRSVALEQQRDAALDLAKVRLVWAVAGIGLAVLAFLSMALS